LYVAAGVVWSVEWTTPRMWLPADGAAVIGGLALLAWSWP
jgi:hypothetical protein